jgi:hypothetical protein
MGRIRDIERFRGSLNTALLSKIVQAGFEYAGEARFDAGKAGCHAAETGFDD